MQKAIGIGTSHIVATPRVRQSRLTQKIIKTLRLCVEAENSVHLQEKISFVNWGLIPYHHIRLYSQYGILGPQEHVTL